MVFSRRAERIYRFVLLVLDFIAINAAFSLAWWIRFRSGLIPLKEFQPYEVYIISASLASFFWLLVFAYRRHYEIDVHTSASHEAEQLLASTIISAFITMALSFLYRQFSYSRLVFAMGTVFSYLFLLVSRGAFRTLVRELLKKGYGCIRTVILGENEQAQNLRLAILRDPYLSQGFMGIIPIQTDELKKILIEKRVGRVILADPTISEELMLELIYECRKENAVFELLPHFQELLKGRAELSRVGNFNLLAIRDVALKEWQRVVKRAMDITISILVILALLPFFLIVALLIKLTSPGPVFYKQVRVGRNGRRFFMYKFRSMYEDADSRVDELLKKYQVASLALIKFKHDPRVTPIGRFLRKYSIDEFPQLINVLKGEMSLVGPRPPLVREVEMYEKWQLKRVDVVPGMTGLWQISGRSDTTFEEMVKLDLEYISNWSIWLDIKILLATPIVVLKGKGAY